MFVPRVTDPTPLTRRVAVEAVQMTLCMILPAFFSLPSFIYILFFYYILSLLLSFFSTSQHYLASLFLSLSRNPFFVRLYEKAFAFVYPFGYYSLYCF